MLVIKQPTTKKRHNDHIKSKFKVLAIVQGSSNLQVQVMEIGHCKMLYARDPLGRRDRALIGRPTLWLNMVTDPGITL